MATENKDDLKSISSPLDLSFKMANISNEEYSDQKPVSSDELLSLKLLHDRLTKTMELLVPLGNLKKSEIKKSQVQQTPVDKSDPQIDYYKTMKTILSLIESEKSQLDNSDCKSSPYFLPNKSQVDAWSYWHYYILSLHLMNSSVSSSIPPPATIPPPTSMSTSIFPPPFNFLSSSPNNNSILFHNMLNNIVNRPIPKSQEECGPTNCFQENYARDFRLKSKKLNSFQFLKDSNSLYNSLTASRNLGVTKNKLLDCPESFGVSLRGNQKYSIYYQQRPNNVFNHNYISAVCSSAIPSKINPTSLSKVSQHNYRDDKNKKPYVNTEFGHKKSMFINPDYKVQKPSDRMGQLEKKFQNSEQGNPVVNSNNMVINHSDNIVKLEPSNLNSTGKCRETVFNCNCGQEFENLYSFTIHMKSTHHTPNSSKIERCIPKLVRGQDMWINSETEQTKEILRCMRCKQSFRTLPELTMHMVETNHYSEIVYSDSGKCVFLNSESDKIRSSSYTTISSPLSSPGAIIRNLKRPLSSSPGSYCSPEEDSSKRPKIKSPEVSNTEKTETEIIQLEEGCKSISKEVILEIIEADSETTDYPTVVSDQSNSLPSKMFENKDLVEDFADSYNSVIRQIENFVEKSLPKAILNEYNMSSSAFSKASVNNKLVKVSNRCSTTKPNVGYKSETIESINVCNKNTETVIKNNDNDKSTNLTYKNYPVSPTENLVNPLSSLQILVETIQKNSAQTKDRHAPQNDHKISINFQNKDTACYSKPSKSASVCDSLNQLQALVSANTSSSITDNERTHLADGFREKHIQQSPKEGVDESSATFISWCHKLGELLGVPRALSQAMLTQDAIKNLSNSVLRKSNNSTESNDSSTIVNEDRNNNISLDIEKMAPCFDSEAEINSFQQRQPGPIEQLKKLLNSTSETSQTDNLPHILSNRFLNESNLNPNSPPNISKKSKCHFCNKPFANKGQVRLHISKGKCLSLVRRNHHLFEASSSNNSSPTINYDGNISTIHKPMQNDEHTDKKEHSSHNTRDTINSVNLIREYFMFAKEMIDSDSN